MADETSGQAYTKGSWKGFTTYRCTLCAFDTMDEQTAREHYLAHFKANEEPTAIAQGEEPITLSANQLRSILADPVVKPLPVIESRRLKHNRRKDKGHGNT
jgi:hypothetical protein